MYIQYSFRRRLTRTEVRCKLRLQESTIIFMSSNLLFSLISYMCACSHSKWIIIAHTTTTCVNLFITCATNQHQSDHLSLPAYSKACAPLPPKCACMAPQSLDPPQFRPDSSVQQSAQTSPPIYTCPSSNACKWHTATKMLHH